MMTFTIPAFILILLSILIAGFGIGCWLILTYDNKK